MSADGSVEFPTQTVVSCEACGSEFNVQWFCKNCPGSLCDDCRETHRTGITKRHSVVPRTGAILRLYGPAKIAEHCRIHTGREITTYCNECRVPCCIICHAENHQRHAFSPIEEKYLSTEKTLNEYVKELEKETKAKLHEKRKQTNDYIAKSEKEVSIATEEVYAFREDMRNAVDDACDTLIDKLMKSSNDAKCLLRGIEIQEENIDKFINDCSARIREGKLDLIEYIPPNPESFIPTSSLLDLSHPHFIPGKGLLDAIRKEVGTIEYKTKEKVSDTYINRFDKAKIKCVEKVSEFRSKIDVTSITTAGNHKAWVMCFVCDTMCLYSDSGELIRSVTVKKDVGINDMVISPSGEMIVTNNDQKVRCVSVSGEVSTLIDTAPFNAKGVCLTDKGEIAVCMTGLNEGNHVAVYSSDGREKLSEIRCQDDQGRQLITNPYRVVQNGEDLCVVNCRSNVVFVDERGGVRWMYDGSQAKLSRSFCPSGICKNRNHNLLVTDLTSNCVHYIDRKGRLTQIILTEEQTGLRHHRGISVDDKTDQVWLGNSSGQVVTAWYLELFQLPHFFMCVLW